MSAAKAAPKNAPLAPGATVAEKYIVRRPLGHGGMGHVLEVEHLALGRNFALKVLRLERWNDELVRRFNREARALARLHTPRVAQVTDFGVDPDVGPFYVMEMLEGETLEQRLERDTRIPVAAALQIASELAAALAEVHAVGIVHRDLKPSNVGLPRNGPVGVKLLDFGLAAGTEEAMLSRITESQQILGSLPYMAPEQFNSAEPSAAMDLYALGVVLYEMVSGRLPFMAPSTAALIHQILAVPPPAMPADLPHARILEPLFERLLAKEASQRFRSAAEAADAIAAAHRAVGTGPHPATRALPVETSHTLPRTVSMSSSGPAYVPTSISESAPSMESGARPVSSPTWAPPTAASYPQVGSVPSETTLPGLPSNGIGMLGKIFVAALGGSVFAVLTALAVVLVLRSQSSPDEGDTPPPIDRAAVAEGSSEAVAEAEADPEATENSNETSEVEREGAAAVGGSERDERAAPRTVTEPAPQRSSERRPPRAAASPGRLTPTNRPEAEPDRPRTFPEAAPWAPPPREPRSEDPRWDGQRAAEW